MQTKNLSVRLDAELLDKLHYIANRNLRSANGQMCVLIRQFVENYEKKYGVIPITRNSKN